jgi:hypothetical protein
MQMFIVSFAFEGTFSSIMERNEVIVSHLRFDSEEQVLGSKLKAQKNPLSA